MSIYAVEIEASHGSSEHARVVELEIEARDFDSATNKAQEEAKRLEGKVLSVEETIF
jgi:hypothetical protein